MSEMRFTEEHEWVRVDDDGLAVVGISDYAQGQLGDVVFVELPDVGKVFDQGDEVAVVESVKAASEVYAPLSGEVIEVNEELTDSPALVNTDPHGEGWFFKVKPSDKKELKTLMDQAAYDAYLHDLG